MLEDRIPIWNVQLFGPLVVQCEGRIARFRTKKTGNVFAYLSMRPDQQVGRETLAAYFWPDHTPESARQSLRMALSDIRSVLGQHVIEAERETVVLSGQAVVTDLNMFFEGLKVAKASGSAKDYRDAIDLVTAPLLSELSEEWVTSAWLRLQEQYARAVAKLLTLPSSEDDSESNIDLANKALEIVGCREDIHAAMIQHFVERGATSRAIQQFEILEAALDELWGEPPSQSTVDLIDKAPRGARVHQPEPTLEKTGFGVSLVGRQALLGQILDHLKSSPGPYVLSLVGMAGAGKTTLARAAADYLNSQSPHSCVFVELAKDNSTRDALVTIQAELGLPIGEPAEAIGAIARAINEHPRWLAFDNCEQLPEDFSVAINKITALAQGTRIITTSRSPLDLPGETIIPIPPMELPHANATLQELRECESVALFLREASRVSPEFSLRPDNARAIAQLCIDLEGLPLALIIAASRIRTHTPAELLATIHESLDWLVGPSVDGRHRSLSRALDWSYKLLTPQAQRLGIALCLYSGEITRGLAREAVGDRGAGELLDDLVRFALIKASTEGEVATFSLYEMVRQYLRAKLPTHPDAVALQKRHFHFVANLLEQSQVHVFGLQLSVVASNMENIRNAILFGRGQEELHEGAGQLLLSAYRVLTAGGNADSLGDELRTMFRDDSLQLLPTTRARIGVAYSATFGNSLSVEEYDDVLDWCQQLAQGDAAINAEIAYRRSNLRKQNGDYAASEIDMQSALGYYESVDDKAMIGAATYSLGLIAYCEFDLQRSLELHLAALRHLRAAGNPNILIRCLFDAGSALAESGQGAEALELFDEAIERSEAVASRKLEGLTRWQKGDALLTIGQPVEALAELQTAIDLVIEAGFEAGLKWIFLKTAEALQKTGRPILAARLLGKGVTQRNAESRPLAVYEQKTLDPVIESVIADLGANGYERHFADGSREEWAQLILELRSSPD